MIFWIKASVWGSTEDVASSSKSTRQFLARALINATDASQLTQTIRTQKKLAKLFLAGTEVVTICHHWRFEFKFVPQAVRRRRAVLDELQGVIELGIISHAVRVHVFSDLVRTDRRVERT